MRAGDKIQDMHITPKVLGAVSCQDHPNPWDVPREILHLHKGRGYYDISKLGDLRALARACPRLGRYLPDVARGKQYRYVRKGGETPSS